MFDAGLVINKTLQGTEKLTSVSRVDAGDFDVLLWHEQLYLGILGPMREEVAPGASKLRTDTATAIQERLNELQKVVYAFSVQAPPIIQAVTEDEGMDSPPPWLSGAPAGGGGRNQLVDAALERNAKIRQRLEAAAASGEEKRVAPFARGHADFHSEDEENITVTLDMAHEILENQSGKDALAVVLKSTSNEWRTTFGADFKLIATYGVLLASLLESKERDALIQDAAAQRSDLLRDEADDRPYLPLWLVKVDITVQRLASLMDIEKSFVRAQDLEAWREVYQAEIQSLHRSLDTARSDHAKAVAFLAAH